MLRESDIYNLIIALLTMGITMLWGKKPKDQPNNDGDASEDDAQYRWTDTEWRVPSYKHWYANNSDYQADERNYWRHQVRALWASVFIGIATLIAAGSAGVIAWWAYQATSAAVIEAQKQTIEAQRQTAQAMRQAEAAEDQIAVAKDTEQRQLRAYVFVDHVQTTNIDDDLTIDDPTKLQSVTVVFKNSGLTPAYNVKQIASLKFTDFPPNQAVFVHDTPVGLASIATIGPQGTDQHVLEPKPNFALGIERKRLLKAGTKAIYVFGKIDYEDAFGVHRCTRYRLMVGGNAGFHGGDMLKMDAGNETDKDCEKPD